MYHFDGIGKRKSMNREDYKTNENDNVASPWFYDVIHNHWITPKIKDTT